MDILTAFAGFAFAIYGLSRAVEDRDDLIIVIGIFVQIGLITWMVDAISRLTGNHLVIFLLGPFAVVALYPVLRGIMRNQIFPADLQIRLRSPVDNRDGGRFIPMRRPVSGRMEDEKGDKWEESGQD